MDKKIAFQIISGIVGIVLIIFTVINFVRIHTLSNQLAVLKSQFASTTETLNKDFLKSQGALFDQLNQQNKNVGDIEQKLGAYNQQVSTVSSTVTTLQKLSKTDPELLAKYSKVFFLNENYAPSRLTQIPSQYAYSDDKILKFQTEAWPYLQKMIDNAKLAGINIYVDSAYRSFNEQQALKKEYRVVYGAGTANSFSADQGYSEHQLGTTVDLITPGLGGQLDGFETTQAYTWMIHNAYHFGFILSYPADNKFYVFEPWHWRFVGVKLATDLHTQNKHFYDMDQRDIDEYLVNLFD